MKYVIVQPQDDRGAIGEPKAILFPDSHGGQPTHKDVARCHRAGYLAVISAGFCSVSQSSDQAGFKSVSVDVWGGSESLGDKFHSRPEDVPIIESLFVISR